jgi:hypothetical protein
MQPHIFLISENEHDHIFVREIASICRAKFASSSSAEGSAGLIDSEELHAVFINADSSTYLDNFQSMFGGIFPSRKVHCFIPHEQRTIAQEIVDYHDIGNIVIRNSVEPIVIQKCAQHYSRVLTANLHVAPPGLSGLCTKGTEVTTKEITQSLQKRFVVEAINGQLAKRNWHPKAANSIATAIDEMIMNAIFDAPMDSNGRQSLSRSVLMAIIS